VLALAALCLPTLIAWVALTLGSHHLALAAQPAARVAQARAALADLQLAWRWSPADPLVARRIAQAHTLLGDYAAAASAQAQAYRLQPSSLLVRQELAAAYLRAGDLARAEPLWVELGVNAERMWQLAEAGMARGAYADALYWYRLAAIRAPDPAPEQLFRTLLAAARARADAPDLVAPGRAAGMLTRVGATGAWLPGSALHWITEVPQYAVVTGTPLNFPRGDAAGIMWWTGEALAVVDVANAGEYQIEARICDCPPAPVALRIGVDGHVLTAAQLTRGNGQYARVLLRVRLEPGLHTLHLWYDNNAVVGALDRDLRLSGIGLRPVGDPDSR
jgi:tetratricopeptide (TPR) repeat protein